MAEAIVEHGGRPDPGRFPIEFTAKNDLGAGVPAAGRSPSGSSRDVEATPAVRRRLGRCMPSLHALAEEILGNARGHLEILEPMSEDEG